MFGRLASRLAGIALVAALAYPAIAQTPVVPAPAGPAKSFVREDLASDGVRLETQLKSESGANAAAKPPGQWRREGEALLARGQARPALSTLAAAVAADPRDAAAWAGFARAAKAISPENWTERYRLQERSVAAAYQAYQRAGSKTDEAAALALLGELYAVRETWRPSLDAYRASLGVADVPAVRATYEGLREKYGFRILDYKVDSDAAAPRVCFQFSETLAPRTDFAPYLAVTNAIGAAVTAEDQQLCVDGLKHGERYAFVVRQGLPSSVGEALLKSADYEVYVKDRAPEVRFSGRNYVLPRTGQAGIPVTSVNAAKVDVQVLRIGDRSLLPTTRSDEYLNQLTGDAARKIAQEKGFRVWSGTLDTAPAELNKDAITAFPVLQAVGKLEPGLYIMVAQPAGAAKSTDDSDSDYENRATQWFVVSDLGLTSFKGTDGVHVFVRSLASAASIADVEVRLIAKNNEVLATKRTDGDGHVAFDAGLARGENGLAPGLVVATKADDYGFLDFNQSAFDLTDRGVKGRPATGGVEALVYPERGVYRSGETAFITALLRDARGLAVPNLPLTLVVKRPDGVEYRRAAVEDQGLGGRAFSLPLLPGAQHGTWRVAAYTDPKGSAVGEASFLVEDYVPERLELTLAPKSPTLVKGQPAEIDLAARYLYGAPGAELDVSGEVVVQAAGKTAIKGLDGFTVGLDDEQVEAATAEIEEHGTTDDKGRVTMSVPVQEVPSPRPLEARITLRVGEEGGRSIERSLTLPILPDGPVLAVRKNFDSELQEGATATFDVVLAQPDGARLPKRGVTWQLSKVERRYQWYRQDGRWSYEPVKTSRRVADGTVDLAADQPARVSSVVTYGNYRLEVRAPGLDGATASVGFTVGWSGDQTADVPDLLDLTLDKAAYAAGDTLKARVNPRFAGRATLAVVSDKVHALRVIDVAEAGSTVEMPVDPAWGAGAYLVAMAHRPLDQVAKRLPGRALGVAWFGVDRASRTLEVKLDAPATIRPRGKLTLPIQLAGLQAGEEARLVVAAVDVGILNLTRYQQPAAFDYFFGQKALSTEVRDLYGYLIDGMQGTLGAIRSGGDAASLNASAIPPTQEPLARYSGLVRVGPDGKAQVEFDVPAFNGTARVMAVAWSAGRVGNATADVIIRDPVVLTGTLPRFLSVGDQSRFHVQLDNVEGTGGDYVVDLDLKGPVLVQADAAHRTVRLGRGGRGSVTIPITAAGPGLATIDLKLTGPGIAGSAGQTFALRVQPGTGATVRRTVRPLEAGGTLSVSNDLLADILPGTGAVSVSVSPLAALDVPGLLQALDRYPYGCTEQTVSRALPLLYVNKLASADHLALDDKLDERVRGAIDKVLSRQGSNGSFGLWSVGGEDTWLDAFVVDFLTRARERNFAVPTLAFNQALDRLRNVVANANVDKNGGEIAYAAYVLARNGRPVMGDLRYLADTKLANFETPLARGQIGAALALLGDRTRSQAVFGSAVEALRTRRDDGRYRPDYGSRLRDGAGLLALVSEAGMTRDALAPIARALEEERATYRTTSTQENAWMVLAAQGLSRDAEAIQVTVDGEATKGAVYRSYKALTLDLGPVAFANRGGAAAQVVVNVTGNPVGPEPAASQGYTVERTYYKLDGEKVDPAKVKQNDRLVTVLKVTEQASRAARLLLGERLPAGFEIDNPKLLDNDALAGLSWLKREVEPETTEFRDDRFVAAFERQTGQPAFFSVAYIVRVVSPGRYVHPPAIIEDMYRPERFGRTAFGSVEVQAARP